MKILLSIEHPAWAHQFHYLIKKLESNHHVVKVVAINKDRDIELLNKFGINFELIANTTGDSIIEKGFLLIWTTFKIYNRAKKFKPDIIIGRASPMMAINSFLLRKKHIVFEDTERCRICLFFCKLFSTIILTPLHFRKALGPKQLRVAAFKELFYLHPHYFQPDPQIWNELNITPGTPFIILRFVSWKASHDFGYKGLNVEEKKALVTSLSRYCKVFISAEDELPHELEPYLLPISPEKIHHALFYAKLYIGEGASMASEAAILGTHAIFLSQLTAGSLDEQEHKFDLVYSFSAKKQSLDHIINKVVSLVERPDLFEVGKKKAAKLIDSTIDINKFFLNLIEEMSSCSNSSSTNTTLENLSLFRSTLTKYRIETAKSMSGNILDCGSGIGDYLPFFNGKVVSFDIRIPPLTLNPNPEKVVGNAEFLPFPDNAFDCTWSCAVAQYLRLNKFMSEAIRVTKDGGRILILVPNGKSVWDKIKRIFGLKSWWQQEGIVTQYSVLDLRNYGTITGEIQFLPFEYLFRNFPNLGHCLMLEVKVRKNL